MPRPSRVFRTEAIVLRRFDLGETDRVLTLYTPDKGKIKALGKGIRRPKSRLAGHLELFMRSEVLISQGRTFDIISQAEVKEGYLPLRQSLHGVTYASHCIELLDGFTQENDENRDFYLLLAAGLTWLSVTEDQRRTARYYELHALDAAGYRPQLQNCVSCGVLLEPEPQYFFSPWQGGAICRDCGTGRSGLMPLPLNVLKVLRYMQRSPFRAIEKLTLSDTVQADLERILHRTLSHYLERRLRSVDFLKRIRRESGQPL